MGNGGSAVSSSSLGPGAMLTRQHQVKRANVTQNKILSVAAKSIISKDIQKGTYSNRVNAGEPAFMAPSVDPNTYSLVGDVGFCASERHSFQNSGVHFASTLGRPSCCVLGVEWACAPIPKAQPVSSGTPRSYGKTLSFFAHSASSLRHG
jgi:hypothetical protein